jgi:hypothetical protein
MEDFIDKNPKEYKIVKEKKKVNQEEKNIR